MKTVYGLLVLVFIIFGTCVLAAPPTFGPPGIAPDPGGELPTANTIPNIEGPWVGEGKDVHKSWTETSSNTPTITEEYYVELSVDEQDGPRFVGSFSAEGITPRSLRVAGYITSEGEITMFGGNYEIEPANEPLRCRLTIKAKYYKNPARSIRGCWQAYCWEEGNPSNHQEVNSGSFVVQVPYSDD